MTTELQKVEPNQALVPADVSAMALQTALAGDLSRLTADDRLKFYGALCQFTGLNPLSKPFDWIQFQGKLVLYANKGCAEQLRKIHRVNIEILERRFEMGCHIVRVKAVDGSGRTDESVGAVPANDKMNPSDLANALMKAETKAKRRATLSICGLGMLDESELDTMRQASVSQVTNPETGTDRAAALNQIVEAEVTSEQSAASESPSGRSTEPETQTKTAVVLGAEVPRSATDAAQPLPNSESPSEPTRQTPEPQASQPIKPETAATGLPTDMCFKLEALFVKHPRTMDFLVARGYLAKGADIATIKKENAEKFLRSENPFIRSVDVWAKSNPKAA